MSDGVLKEMVLRGRARTIDRADTLVADAVAAKHGKLVTFWTSFRARFKVVGKGCRKTVVGNEDGDSGEQK